MYLGTAKAGLRQRPESTLVCTNQVRGFIVIIAPLQRKGPGKQVLVLQYRKQLMTLLFGHTTKLRGFWGAPTHRTPSCPAFSHWHANSTFPCLLLLPPKAGCSSGNKNPGTRRKFLENRAEKHLLQSCLLRSPCSSVGGRQNGQASAVSAAGGLGNAPGGRGKQSWGGGKAEA